MNEQAGPASALSVLIIGVFAILLHDRQPPSKPSSPPAISKVASTPGPIEPIVAPRRTKPVSTPTKPAPLVSKPQPPIEKPKPEPSTVEITKRPEPASTKQAASSKSSAAPLLPPSGETAVKRSLPTAPKSPFTVVQEGEKLADVANRVYGTSDAAESLWRANRDQVSLIDSPLSRGTLLRTP